MKNKPIEIILILILIVLGFIAIQLTNKAKTPASPSPSPVVNKSKATTSSVLQNLFDKLKYKINDKYIGGLQISECPSRGMMFYSSSSVNMSDDYTFYYNPSGKEIGSSGGFGPGGLGNNSPEYDGNDFRNCEIIYSTGIPGDNAGYYRPVNKYNLK